MGTRESNMRGDQRDLAITSERLNNLGRASHGYYEKSGNLSHLDDAIGYYNQAFNLCPPGHPDRLMSLNNMGNAMQARYGQLREINDLEKAITCFQEGLELSPPGHSGRLMSLINLVSVLYNRYEHLGKIEDLGRAITHNQEALESHPPGHSLRAPTLGNLAMFLQTRYTQLGKIEDLEKAITFQEEALELHPPGHHGRSISLVNLASALYNRYEQLGKAEDLERAIICNQEALESHPPGHPLRAPTLNGLALDLQTRYTKLGEIEDLEKTITFQQEALELRPPGHHHRSMSLINLASALHNRYEKLGEIEDLEKAITLHQQALELCPPGHHSRVMSLNNLANALKSRYESHGEMKDLEEAIACQEEALELRPPGHPDRSSSLNNLASALYNRYSQLGEIHDLEQASTYYQQALELCPPGHVGRSLAFSNLATILHSRYDWLGNMDDLEKAITLHEQALELSPSGHPGKSSYLTTLGNTLRSRYKQHKKTEDLEKTIICDEQALELCPPGHPDRSLSLTNLGMDLWMKYHQLGETDDLVKAFKYNQEALELCPPGHPARSKTLNNLGNIWWTSYDCLREQHCLEKALFHYKEAASTISNINDRLVGAKHWALISHMYGHSSAIPAYSLALNVLQQHLALLPSIISQQNLVEKHFYLSLDAAACAIGTSTPEMAVEFLEQGRSILWSKIQGYRQSLVEIAQKAPELAQESQLVCKQLEYNATSGSVDFSHQRALSERWTALLRDIRKLDGFSNYLQATPFSNLQDVSTEGPVIMLNVSKFRSDAIILVPNSSPVVVPLHAVSPKILKQLADQLSSATTSSDSSTITYKVLQQLWNIVVSPVVDQLAKSGIVEKSHIWWCPTSYLCALPLHAAGPYKRGFKNLPDLYISSYTPTLTSLIKARSTMPKPQAVPALLLVSQPDDTIPHVFEEVNVINSLQVQITSCSGHAADKQSVVLALQSHPWVHFACHGHLDAQPFNSWFQLHNREHLTVLDLAKAQLPNAEFAFLSACHSAAGGVHSTPDESIHLAGALQFSGFRSVVGTLWAMVDDDGPSLANEFYKSIFHNQSSVDLRDVAAALNVATKELRRKNISIDRWINFIHIGA